jgi:hypothetical protein
MIKLFTAILFLYLQSSFASEVSGRIASIYISQTFINEQLSEHFANSEVIKEIKSIFDPATNNILLKGRLQLPVEDFKAMGIDPKMLQFNFKMTIRPSLTEKGFLVLEFPLSETYFYQANSKNPEKERVIIPVQLLSLGVASIRGYLAALSGDFSGFDRKQAKLKALLKGVNRNIKDEKNEDAKKILLRERKSLELQIASLVLEREKFEQTAGTLSKILGFSGNNQF